MTVIQIALGSRVRLVRYPGVSIFGIVTNIHFGDFGIPERFEIRTDGGAYVRDLSHDDLRAA